MAFADVFESDIQFEDNGALIERIRSAAELISFDETHPDNQRRALGIIRICDVLSSREINPAVAEQNRLQLRAARDDLMAQNPDLFRG